MANFETRTVKQIYDGIITKYTTLRSQYGDTSPLLERAAIRSIAYAFAGIAGTLWQLATWIYKQCFAQTAELETLKFWGDLVGVIYQKGNTANLTITLTSVTAQNLLAGTTYKHLSSGLIYKTVSTVNNSNGTIIATAQCTTPGEVGNLATGEELQIANPYDGIPSTATVSAITIKGSEDENIEAYRKRVLIKYRSKSQGGSALDYYNWSMEVPGIVDALPYTLSEGEVDIYLVAEGSGNQRTPSGSVSPNPFPNWVSGVFQDYTGSGDLLAVANSIEGTSPGVHDRRPMCAKVRLRSPNYTAYSIEITGMTTTVFNTQIKDALVRIFDTKRPHIKVLGYKEANAKINALSLSAEVSSVIGDETFTTFTLKDSGGSSINEATLGVGCLAYLSSLKINGSNVPI